MKTKLYLAGALALVLIGAYAGRKYAQAGGASGLAFDFASTIWNNAAGVAANIGGAVLDAMPSSQLPGVVDTVNGNPKTNPVNMTNPLTDTGTLLYESALMGGGS